MPAPDHPQSIAILHYASYPVIGGVESIMATHARLLEESGHRPYILTGRGDPGAIGLKGSVLPEIDSKHPEIVRVQAALLAGEEWAAPAFEEWVVRIYATLSDALGGTDTCIVHNAFTLHKNLALTAALARLAERQEGAKRWIAWCHDLAWTNPLYQDELLPQWPWNLLRTRLPNVKYVAISEQRHIELAQMLGVHRRQIEYVPNGIDPSYFIPCSPQMAELRRELSWDERDWVLLAPVRITRRKNLELAIEIVAAIRDLGHRPLLLVTGPPGPHNMRSDEYLRELLAQRAGLGLKDEAVFLALEGRGSEGLEVSDSLMVELYMWSDALLVTSVQEGFGLPLLEAGLLRLPIFCSNLPVLREVGGENAIYFNPQDDPPKIAETILNTLEAPGVAAMRHKVMNTYTWDAILHSRILPLIRNS